MDLAICTTPVLWESLYSSDSLKINFIHIKLKKIFMISYLHVLIIRKKGISSVQQHLLWECI